MAFEVRLSHRANKALAAIYHAKDANISLQAADWYLGLRDAILALKDLPVSGVLTREDHRLRHLLYGSKPHIYRILYTIDERTQTVNVIQVRHGARRPLRTYPRR